MRKIVLLFLLSTTLLSCSEKEKTYEELETEVLCDVLPQIAKEYFEFTRFYHLPPPPPDINNNKHLSTKEIDSINKQIDLLFVEYNSKNKNAKDSIIKLIQNDKKVTFGIVDTIWGLSKNEIPNSKNHFIPSKDSLLRRSIFSFEFEKSTLNVKTISLDSLFEGEIRNQPNVPLIALTRVLFDKKFKNAYFEVYKMYSNRKIFCVYSEEKQKWVVKEIIKE